VRGPLVWLVVIVAVAVAAVAADRALFRPATIVPTPAPSGPLGIGSAPPAPSASPAATTVPFTTPLPTRTPTASCPPVPEGGRPQAALHSLADVRVGHQPGFDRVVFDFGQESSASDDLPAFRVERASSFGNTAGFAVPVTGSALWSVRFEGASIANERGELAYKGPRDLDPTTQLVRDVKLVDDFEAVMVWGIGLERLECPRVTTLRSPLRLVLDFPSLP